MEILQIARRWTRVKTRLKDAYPQLSERDLLYRKGHENELIRRLERKTGKGTEELVSWMTGLSKVRL
jgi:hypothetical protein